MIPINLGLLLGSLSNLITVLITVIVLKKMMPKKRHYMYMNNVPKLARQSDEAYVSWGKLFREKLLKWNWLHLIGVLLSLFIPPFTHQKSSDVRWWFFLTVMIVLVLLTIHLYVAYSKALTQLKKEFKKR